MVGEALQAQNIIPAPLITLQVKSATQYQVQLMYQHGSATPDTFPGFQQQGFFLRCDFQLNNSLNVPGTASFRA